MRDKTMSVWAVGILRAHVVFAVAALAIVGCDAKKDPVRQLSADDAYFCLRFGEEAVKQHCIGQIAQYVGKVSESRSDGYEIRESSDVRIIVLTDKLLEEDASVRITGVITDYRPIAIEASNIEVLSPPPPTTKPRQSKRKLSPEAEIARNREMGAKALEEWDAAIRQNNTDIKAALAAKAVSHSVSNSGDLLVDVYGMPDGRFIACKTVVGSVGAPIVSCDGEP